MIGAAKRVGGEEGVERLMPRGGEVAFEHHYIARAEIRDIQGHPHLALPVRDDAVHDEILDIELSHAVPHDDVARHPRGEGARTVLDEAGIIDIRGTRTREESDEERKREIYRSAKFPFQRKTRRNDDGEQQRYEPVKMGDGVERFRDEDARREEKGEEADGSAVEDPPALHRHFAV